MNQSAQLDVFLNPGEVHFSTGKEKLKTLLGSCVSIVLWHPVLRVGGMCHFILPSRHRSGPNWDGRYANEAINLLLGHIDKQSKPRQEYQAKIFGGGRMFDQADNQTGQQSIGFKNILAARELVREHGFEIVHQHVGGLGHRLIEFDVNSGKVSIEHSSSPMPVEALNQDQIKDRLLIENPPQLKQGVEIPGITLMDVS